MIEGQNASCRVRSDFWMQTFPDFFQKQQFLFPDSRLSHRWWIETFKKNAETKLLFHDALQKYRRDWIRFDQNEKNSTYKALTVSKKKNQDFLSYFQTISPFSRYGKLLGKFQEFFKNSRLFTNPGVIRLRSMHSIHSSWTSKRMLATYVPSMRKSNLKIRIAAVLIARNNH